MQRLDAGFTGPVDYPAWLLVLVVAPPLLVLLWCAAVVWRTREPRAPAPGPAPDDVRREALARLDAIERAAAAGDLAPRAAHHRIARVCRDCLVGLGVVEARSMTLTRARGGGPPAMVEVLDIVYPPEFEPGTQGSPEKRLDPALQRARGLVSTWEP